MYISMYISTDMVKNCLLTSLCEIRCKYACQSDNRAIEKIDPSLLAIVRGACT